MNAFLIDGVRTPIGNFGGTLSPIRTDDLAAHALRAPVSYTHLRAHETG